MIAAPGIKGGKRIGELTQSVDLLPTLMALSGVKKSRLGLHGHSLKPLMSDRGKKWPRQYAFSSTFIRNGGPSITDGQWTYISYGEQKGRPEFYDIRKEPGQKRNVIRQYPGVRKRMEQALAEFLQKVGTPKENYELLGPIGGPDYA